MWTKSRTLLSPRTTLVADDEATKNDAFRSTPAPVDGRHMFETVLVEELGKKSKSVSDEEADKT